MVTNQAILCSNLLCSVSLNQGVFVPIMFSHWVVLNRILWSARYRLSWMLCHVYGQCCSLKLYFNKLLTRIFQQEFITWVVEISMKIWRQVWFNIPLWPCVGVTDKREDFSFVHVKPPNMTPFFICKKNIRVVINYLLRIEYLLYNE